MKRLAAGLSALVAAVILSACAFAPVSIAKSSETSPAPSWLNRGGSLYADPGGVMSYHAVAMVIGVRNEASAIADADASARKELAKLIGNAGTAASAVRTEHWIDPSSGTVYSRASVPVDALSGENGDNSDAADGFKAEPSPETSKPKDWWAK